MDGQGTKVRVLAGPKDMASPQQGKRFTEPPNLIPPECSVITPEMLPLVELDKAQLERIVRTVPGGARNIQDIYPLAPLQEGILFHHTIDGKGDTYVALTLLEFQSRGQLNEFIAALQAVVDRHDVLRSAILWEQLPLPVQVVYRRAAVPVEELELDVTRHPIQQMGERMHPNWQNLDLRQAPLIRLQINFDPRTGHWYALLQIHHLVCDGQSLGVLIAEVISHLRGLECELPEPMQYRRHVAQTLAQARIHDAEAFFHSKLGDIDEATAPYGLADVYGDGSRIEEARRALDPSLARCLRTEARRQRVSPATLFHAVWGIVVSRTSGRDDVVFGTVLLGRLGMSGGTRQKVGLFLNTLPLRLRTLKVSAQALLFQTQRELFDLLDYEQISLAIAKRVSGISGSAPLFTTLLNYRHGVRNPESEWSNLTSGIRVLATRAWTNYPITLSVDDLGDGFMLTAQTDRQVDPNRILDYVEMAVQSLVEAVQRAPEAPVLSLSILPESERLLVTERFNSVPVEYPGEKLIHTLFEEQVERTPTVAAVVHGVKSYTYAEINGKANRLARYLRRMGVVPDQRVGICVERSLEMAIGVLGILKAGGAYLPLDPGWPVERLRYTVEDAAPRLLLTQGHLKTRMPQITSDIIALDDDWDDIAQESEANLEAKPLGLNSHQLAYVIYTSGSTGHPKGVMVEHRNVVNHWRAIEHLYREPNHCRRIAINAPFTFDASVQQFVQLLSGCTLFIVPQELRLDSQRFFSFIQRNQVEGIDCTPSQLNVWVSAGLLDQISHVPITVLVGGEAIDSSLWSKLVRCSPLAFYNVYGPTECTVDSTVAYLEGTTEAPHIGHPLENTRVYILDSHRQIVPVGVVGEIYISGAGVARGYLNRPELTAERFIADPFRPDMRSRMYKTGDLGRWRQDGTIECLGRSDHQVKIRGFRIELGEIEAQLSRHIQVKEAVVLAREDVRGEKRLVAYVIPRDPNCTAALLSVGGLRAHLRSILPDYMVPGVFVALNSLPLMPNGKLDRSALPAPELGRDLSQPCDAPQDDIEQLLAGIWSEVLRIEHVGRYDNFFELGGHSLLGMKLIAALTERLPVRPPVASIFQYPTIEQMAQLVRKLLSIDSDPMSLSRAGIEDGII